MKKKFLITLKSKKYYGIITAVSWGIFTILALVSVCGICMTQLDIPDAAVYAASCFTLGMGGYISGYILGKNKRHNGIISGLKCGLWLWAAVTVLGIVSVRSLSITVIIRDLFFLCIPAVIGGIYGVNKKNYRAPFNKERF